MLDEVLSGLPRPFADTALLVGMESRDDAAVYRIDDGRAVVATTDFFTPIVDDPYDFGRIAAANALSDIYAIGGRPIFALAVLGVPVDKLPVETIGRILEGGIETCAAAGIAVAGGHSIDAPEPFYGLVAIGLVDPAAVKRNDGAQPGDVLILGKPLGVGILSAALHKGDLDAPGYAELLDVATRLNTVGESLAGIAGVHAMTDVTGFGLLGHLLEICRGSGLASTVDSARLPVLPAARALAARGYSTGAATRNWASYGPNVTLPADSPDGERNLLCDPQTNGGLLVSCAPDEADRVIRLFHEQGHAGAGAIGVMVEGKARIVVR